MKTKWKFPYIRPAVGQTEGILTWVLCECTSQLSKKMSLKLRERSAHDVILWERLEKACLKESNQLGLSAQAEFKPD